MDTKIIKMIADTCHSIGKDVGGEMNWERNIIIATTTQVYSNSRSSSSIERFEQMETECFMRMLKVIHNQLKQTEMVIRVNALIMNACEIFAWISTHSIRC